MRYEKITSYVSNGFFAYLLILVFAAGCGVEPRSNVSRSEIVITVKNAGELQTIGTVDITNPTSGEGASEVLNDSGTVRLRGIAHGDYVVTVLPPPSLDAAGNQLPPSTKKFTVGKRFQSADVSPLKITIDGKTTTFEVEVDSAK